MSTMNRLLVAVAFSATAFSAMAQDRVAVSNDPTRATRVSTSQATQQQLVAQALVDRAGPKSTNAVTATRPGQPIANDVRAYPPSCLADPLPDATSGPVYRNSNVNLAAFNTGTGTYVQEAVTISVWRVACSSPLTGLKNGATLLRVDRQARYEGDAVVYPLFPATRVKQGSIGYGNANLPKNLIRIPNEPNTVIADTLADAPIIYSTTYVLENYQSASAGYFDFNAAFGIQFNNQFSSNNLFTIDVPDYNPTQASYPDAFANVPFSGYLGTNYYDPTHDGEGMLFHVFEVGANGDLVISLSWFTFDNAGIPFWLYASGPVARGSRSADLTVGYRTGGVFAGASGGGADANVWGTINVAFPSCNNLRFTYRANAGLPAGVPTGTGTRNWQRLANINGLACE